MRPFEFQRAGRKGSVIWEVSAWVGTPSSAKMVVDFLAFVGGQAPLDGGHVLLQFLGAADADQGDGDRGVAEDPRDGELGDRLAVAGGDWPQPFDHAQLLQELLALEQGQAEGVAHGAPVPVDERGGLVEGAVSSPKPSEP